MEGAAIAHTAYVNKLPFLIIRAISDFADEDAENSFDSFENVAADRAAFIVKEMLSV
jgi:adenosylhomocysteine nucleosidase